MAREHSNTMTDVRARRGWFPRGWTPIPIWGTHGPHPDGETVRAITAWCADPSVAGDFIWHPDMIGLAFSDPDTALAFKVRWV